MIDEADQDKNYASSSVGHSNTWATVAMTRWRCRSCVGSGTPTRSPLQISKAKFLTDSCRRSAGGPRGSAPESDAAITLQATASTIRIKSCGRIAPHGAGTAVRAVHRSCNHRASDARASSSSGRACAAAVWRTTLPRSPAWHTRASVRVATGVSQLPNAAHGDQGAHPAPIPRNRLTGVSRGRETSLAGPELFGPVRFAGQRRHGCQSRLRQARRGEQGIAVHAAAVDGKPMRKATVTSWQSTEPAQQRRQARAV